MKYKFTAQCEAVRSLKREVDKSLGDIYKTLEDKIESLENEIDKKNKKIDELNKEIEELEKTKKAVINQNFNCTEVNFRNITSEKVVILASVYICPELFEVFKQGIIQINNTMYYLGDSESIQGRIKTKLISCSVYDFNEAQKIAKELLDDCIYKDAKIIKV